MIYDFADSRSGLHAREFLGSWSGKLVCDDYSGYKALFERGVIEIGCMAHARRKFHDLYANHRSDIAEEALEVLRCARTRSSAKRGSESSTPTAGDSCGSSAQSPSPRRCDSGSPASVARCPDGSATAKAIEYSLGRWAALIRYLEDGDLPIDNNHIENRITAGSNGALIVHLMIKCLKTLKSDFPERPDTGDLCAPTQK